jgi:hypothetical protein
VSRREIEAKLASRVGKGQDDSARRAARDVQARRFNGCQSYSDFHFGVVES